MNKRFFVFILLLCSLNTCVLAQNNNFRQWSIKEGLPQTDIYCITQDQRGYLWIGTGGGLSMFDGKNFKTFTKKEGLGGNVVRSVLEDSRGYLYFGTDEGISVYDGFNFNILNASRGLSGSTVLCLMEDNEKNIWAGTDDGGINKLIPLGKDSFLVNVFNQDKGLSSNAVFDFFQDKENNIWAATFGGINILHPVKNQYEIQYIKGKDKIPSDMLLSISPDADGDLWFGTYDAGAFKLGINRIKENELPVAEYNTSNGLNGNSVWDILFTKEKNIWFGTTQNGINRFIPEKGNKKYKIASYTTRQGLPGSQILCLFEDKERNIWIGTNGDGLSMLPGDHFAHYREKDGLENTKIQGIEQDANGNYWLASSGGGVTVMNLSGSAPVVKTYTEKDGLSSNFITSIAAGQAENRNIWMGTVDKGIVKFDGNKFTTYNENSGLINDRVNSLLVDAKGIVWCGTANGISRYDGVRFLNVSTDKLKMNDQGVKAILQDKRENIWFATAGGLARYSGEGTIRTFDEKEGLMSVDVNALAQDKQGNIWIGTNSGGIYKFNIQKSDTTAIELVVDDSLISSNTIYSMVFQDDKTLIVGTTKGFDKIFFDASGKVKTTRNYNYSDGFTGVECNDNAIYKDKAGDIWFGTMNGLTRYSSLLERKNLIPPIVHLIGIQLFYKNVNWSSKSDSVSPWFFMPSNLKLPYYENNLTFHFSAISFSNPEKIRYKYKLEGRDNDWSPEKFSDEVTFSGLSKGSYIFKVMAVNADGMWSEPEVFSFIIVPPWYETSLFYISCIVIIGLSIYLFIKLRVRKLQQEKRILEEIVTERTKEVVKEKEHVAEKNREITDSINYAKGIQDAILPTNDFVLETFPESFILFKPKDIVSGDFFWVDKQDDKTFFAAIDCTGHGVPGGFVSMVGSNSLNRSVKEYGITDPAKILDRMSALVEETFSKRKDGMDIALCAIDHKNKILEFAGANNPLYLIRANDKPLVVNGEIVKPTLENDKQILYEFKADKQPIGSFEGRKNFTKHIIELDSRDNLYVFTDGYADQFGGPQGKKFLYKKMKELLISVSQRPMNEQHRMLELSIESWKGDLEQVDDICIIGVRII